MQINAALFVCLAWGASVIWGQTAPQAPVPPAGQTAPPSTAPPKAPPAPGTPAPAPGQTLPRSPVPEAEKPYPYVRKISFGATLSVMGLKAIKPGSVNVVTTTPAVDSLYNTAGASQRIGYGLMAQIALTERWALSGSFLIHKIGYTMDSDIIRGTTTVTTSQSHEDTRARVHDIPIVVRHYFLDRHTPGPRFFLELGGALRSLRGIRTSISDTDNDGKTTCCRSEAAVPAHRTVRGFVGGAGVQLIDPVGLRVVPEVRYTRWMGNSFDHLSTRTQRNQIEAMISLTF